MSDWTQDYGGMDYVKLAEKIYELQAEMKSLELELSEENLRYQYIPKRKELVVHGVMVRLALFVLSVLFMCWTFTSNGWWMFLDVYVAIADITLLFGIGKRLLLLIFSRDTDEAVRFAEKHGLNTFQIQKRNCEHKISLLQNRMTVLEHEITERIVQKKEQIKEKEQRENILREKGILYDENPINKASAKFSLRQESRGEQDVSELYEFYLKEERYLNQSMLQIEGELSKLDKQIAKIDEDFDQIIKQIIFSVIIYILIILVQSMFTGALGTAIAVISFTVSLCYLFYMEQKCSHPIIQYLVEHDSPLIVDYAFCNGLAPLKRKREQLLERQDQVKKEIEDIHKQKYDFGTDIF